MYNKQIYTLFLRRYKKFIGSICLPQRLWSTGKLCRFVLRRCAVLQIRIFTRVLAINHLRVQIHIAQMQRLHCQSLKGFRFLLLRDNFLLAPLDVRLG